MIKAKGGKHRSTYRLQISFQKITESQPASSVPGFFFSAGFFYITAAAGAEIGEGQGQQEGIKFTGEKYKQLDMEGHPTTPAMF